MGQTTSHAVGRLFTQPKSKAYDQLTWVKKRIGERPGCADNSNSGTGERDVETTLKEPLSDYLSKVKAPY